MTLRSEIIAVQSLEPGRAVGYGGAYTATRACRIGVVACGYADGYPRHAPYGTPVLVHGRKARIAGRVSMDMITVDITELPEAGVGSPVTLWGEGLPVDEVATRRVHRRLRAALRRRASRAVSSSATSSASTSRSDRTPNVQIVVTGAAGFIGANLVKALNRRGVDRHHRGRQPDARRQVRESRRLRDRRIPRQGRVPRAPCGRRLRRRRQRRAAPGRLLRHDGNRRPVHDAQQLPLFGRVARLVPEQRRPVSLRVERRGVRRRAPCFARSAHARRRSMSTATRNSCSTSMSAGCCRSAPRRSRDSAISTSMVRASSTRVTARRSRGTSSSSTAAKAACALFEGSGGYAAGEQRRDFVAVEDVVEVNLDFLDHPGAQRHLQPRQRARRDVQCRSPTATVNACRAAAGEAPRSLGGARGRRRHPLHPAAAGARGQVPELHRGRPRATARAGYAAPMQAIDEGIPRYVERLISASALPPRSLWDTAERRACRATPEPPRTLNSRMEGLMKRLALALALGVVLRHGVRRDQSQHRHQGRAGRAARASARPRRRRSSTTATRTGNSSRSRS